MLSDDFLQKVNRLLQNYKDIDALNKYFKNKTKFLKAFENINELELFKEFIRNFQYNSEKKKDLGDLQTPNYLTDIICNYLSTTGFAPNLIIEPTCGIGNFIISALKYFPSLKNIYCVELQKEHLWFFILQLLHLSFEQEINAVIEFYHDNIFTHRFSDRLMRILNTGTQNILVLGNPPWITNTELSILDSNNVPSKSNIKGVRGIEAMTGKGNFDIAEYIIIRMIQQFSNIQGKIAMLCKTSVIKNIVKAMRKLNLKLSDIQSLHIDAKKEFNINAEAGLFTANFRQSNENFCTNSSLYQPNCLFKKFGWVDDRFVSDIELYMNYRNLDGQSPCIWRQGIKHDAAKVMVLLKNNKVLINGLQERVDIENDLLFPLIKSSDLQIPLIRNSDRKVIIPQRSLYEKTSYIASEYPRLWNYLVSHSEYLDNRKSAIYKKRPRFSIFGIGDYAFKPYKIAISGFYKKPTFSLILPINNKPAMLDDTCYYLFFEALEDAFFTWLLLNMDSTKAFLSSITFPDAKRPFAKEILMRIDLFKLAESTTFDALNNFYEMRLQKYLDYKITENDFLSYFKKLIL